MDPGLGVGLALVFVLWERRYRANGRNPVLDSSLLSISSYRNGVIITAFWFGAMAATLLMVTLFNQQGLGHSPVVVGLITVPFAVVTALVAAVVGRFTYRYASILVIWGCIIFTASLLGLVAVSVLVSPDKTPLAMAIVLAIAGLGPGFVMAANQMRTLMHVPVAQGGVAGSFQQVGQRLGNATCIAVASAVFYALVAAVPRDDNGLPDPTDATSVGTYSHAFQMAMTALILFSVIAFIVAIIDHRSQRQDQFQVEAT